jgi:hypothetical protein
MLKDLTSVVSVTAAKCRHQFGQDQQGANAHQSSEDNSAQVDFQGSIRADPRSGAISIALLETERIRTFNFSISLDPYIQTTVSGCVAQTSTARPVIRVGRTFHLGLVLGVPQVSSPCVFRVVA